jgi:transcriptional regulator with GAF, ATPase, and Fis domain
MGVFPIELPPLRDRKADIPALAAHFLHLAGIRLNRPRVRLTDQDLHRLAAYDWPGNVRELQHVIERAVILAQGDRMRLDLALPRPEPHSVSSRAAAVDATPDQWPASDFVREDELRRRERQNLLAALERAHWKVYGPGGAAELLGVKATTLASRMRSLGIKRQSP